MIEKWRNRNQKEIFFFWQLQTDYDRHQNQKLWNRLLESTIAEIYLGNSALVQNSTTHFCCEPTFACYIMTWQTTINYLALIVTHKTYLSLDSVLSLGESLLSLLLLESLSLSLSNSESSSDSSGLLDTEILGDVLLVLVELTELLSLSEVDDSQDSGNRLSDLRDLGRFDALGRLLDAELGELLLETGKLLLKLSLVLVTKFRSLNTNLLKWTLEL